MTPLRRTILAAAILLGTAMTATPASAAVDGACEATFNGIAIDRIDALGSPLELDTSDTLTFEGVSEEGTLTTSLRLLIGPMTIDSSSATYNFSQQEFSASISLQETGLYAVGLFRVIGEVDDCVAEAWVRVSGRFPGTTLMGLVALALTLGGITGQLGAVVGRRRWPRAAAGLGGIATGSGIALIGQQVGRLQISYPSLTLMWAAAAGLGLAGAALLNPALRSRRRDQGGASHLKTMAPSPRQRVRGSQAGPDESEPVPPDDEPFWGHVLAPTDVFDLTDHTRVVARLEPGTWYLVRRRVGGWAQVEPGGHPAGWVAEGAIRRRDDRRSTPG